MGHQKTCNQSCRPPAQSSSIPWILVWSSQAMDHHHISNRHIVWTHKKNPEALSVSVSLCLWQQQPSSESHAQEHGLGTQRAAFLICFYRKLTFLLGMYPCWGREVVVIMHEPFRTSSSAEKICHNNFVVDEEDWHPPWQDRWLREIKRILPQPNDSFCFQTTTTTTHVFLLP